MTDEERKLQQRRKVLLLAAKALNDTANEEKRAMTEDEESSWAEYMKEIDRIDDALGFVGESLPSRAGREDVRRNGNGTDDGAG